MKKFLVVAKDLLTEQSRSLGVIEAESKEALVRQYGLNKGVKIQRMEYYWWRHLGEMLVFIHEVVDVEITNEKDFEKGIRQFHADCY